MHSRMESIGFSTYFNDVINRFYEDEKLVATFGRTLGFDVEKDVFMGVMLLYPSTERSTYQEREFLREKLTGLQNIPAINKAIDQNQFFYVDNGVASFLVGHGHQEIMEILPAFKEEVLKIIESMPKDKKIRLGIGLPKSGISGIKDTYSYAEKAIKAGEIFKKERTVLEYMGMEIYSSINAMVTNYGKHITDIVLELLSEMEIRVLAKYYKCKEDVSTTAKVLDMSPEQVTGYLDNVKRVTGLDVHDTEDSFKLHLLMIAKKVLDTNRKIKEAKETKEYEFILLDIDDTLLDFQANEEESFAHVMKDNGYEEVPKYLEVYKEINHQLWKDFEQGYIPKSEVLNTRFSKTMAKFGVEVDGAEWEKQYRSYLNKGAQLIEGAVSTCLWLKNKYKLYIVSNGVSETQRTRLDASGLAPYFEDLFISEEVGSQKPSKEFFAYVEKHIPGFDKEKALIVGDSYSSDIQGGLQYGIDTCWFIRGSISEENGKKSTYRISRLKQLKDILG